MPRRISITSRKPVVVTIAARGKLRVISAFVATVEPCEKTVTSRRSTLAAPRTPSITASIGSAGVDGTFATEMAPVSSSSTQMSVNVPPTSQATRKRVTIASWEQACCATTARRSRAAGPAPCPWLKPRCRSSVGSTKPSPALATILPPDSNSYSISPEIT